MNSLASSLAFETFLAFFFLAFFFLAVFLLAGRLSSSVSFFDLFLAFLVCSAPLTPVCADTSGFESSSALFASASIAASLLASSKLSTASDTGSYVGLVASFVSAASSVAASDTTPSDGKAVLINVDSIQLGSLTESGTC